MTELEDDGHAVSFQALARGTPVRTADGVTIGKVRRVHEAKREHIFDGIDVDTPDGLRFLDAPEVARLAERWVTTTFPAAEKDAHLTVRGSGTARRASGTSTAGWLKRVRERWHRR